MNQVVEFFKGLFAYDQWPPRWHCGYWSDFHGWLYIVSDLLIWLAYFLLPLIIIHYFIKKKTGIRFRAIYLLFASFILLCGATHFMDAVMFWIPVYRLNAVIRFATGVVSICTVYHLIRVLPEMVRQRSNTELEREIQLRLEAEERLAEANKGLQAFAYIASHDLQEPLRKISVFTSLILEENRENFSDNSLAFAAKVVKSAERMQTLITDVLTLSSITDDIQLHGVDPGAPIGDAIENLEAKIAETRAVITIGTIPRVKGHPAYLTQLFYNLFNNALKFSRTEPVIRVTGVQSGAEVVIRVSDNGIGMNEADTGRIFQAFHRLHAKDKYEGSGIGLAICEKIVTIHGGTIRVESKLGEGTTFVITLRAAEPATALSS